MKMGPSSTRICDPVRQPTRKVQPWPNWVSYILNIVLSMRYSEVDYNLLNFCAPLSHKYDFHTYFDL